MYLHIAVQPSLLPTVFPKHFIIPKRNIVRIKQQLPFLQPLGTTVLSVCMNLPILGISHKRNHTVFVLLCLASFSWGFPSSLVGKESACNARDPGSIPGSGRSPGEGNGSPLQYSCLENSMDRGPGGPQSMGLQRVRHDCATNFPFLSFH